MDGLLRTPALVVLLVAALLLVMETGRRLGRRWALPGGEDRGVAAVEGSMFALFGLILAFTFTGAAERFDHRRELIAREANAIGTVWLRLDLLPAPDQPRARALLREYVQQRLVATSEADGAAAAGERAASLQQALWSHCVQGVASVQGGPVLLLPALNELIDLTTTRESAARMHPPGVVYLLLVALALGSALLAGHAMGARPALPWLHMLAFALVTAITIYVIVELEFPRMGLVRIEASDALLRDLLRSMR